MFFYLREFSERSLSLEITWRWKNEILKVKQEPDVLYFRHYFFTRNKIFINKINIKIWKVLIILLSYKNIKSFISQVGMILLNLCLHRLAI